MTYELKNGEQVEILTTRQGSPSRDWMNPHRGYLHTSRAKARVRQWFKQQDLEQNTAAGRTILERELHRLGVTGLSYEKLAHQFKYQAVDELLAAIGRGDVNATQLASAVNALAPRDKTADDARPRRTRKGATATADGISVRGVGNLLTTMARCCHPVPNDPVVGYITRGRGVTIHRQDCGNVLRLQGEDLDRLIEVEWGAESDAGYLTDIRVLAYDRAGLLRDITGVLANEKINLLGANTATDKEDGMARMSLTVEITDINQLSRALTLIGQLPNVVEARRKV